MSHPEGTVRAATPAEVIAATGVLKLLADPTRLAMLAMLDGRELTVSAIAAALERPVPAVSQHLAKLRAHGLVVARRAGSALQHAEHLLHDSPPHHLG